MSLSHPSAPLVYRPPSLSPQCQIVLRSMPVFPALPPRLLSRFRPCLSLTSLLRLFPDPSCTRTILPRLLPDPACTCVSRLAYSWNPRLSPTSPLPTVCQFVLHQNFSVETSFNKAGYRLSLVSRGLHFGSQRDNLYV